jgi:hypothetical protein
VDPNARAVVASFSMVFCRERGLQVSIDKGFSIQTVPGNCIGLNLRQAKALIESFKAIRVFDKWPNNVRFLSGLPARDEGQLE